MGIDRSLDAFFLFLPLSLARALLALDIPKALAFPWEQHSCIALSPSPRSELEEAAAFERESETHLAAPCLDRRCPLPPTFLFPSLTTPPLPFPHLFPSSTSSLPRPPPFLHLLPPSTSTAPPCPPLSSGRAPPRLAPAHLHSRRHLLRPEAPHSLAAPRRGGDAARRRRRRRRQALGPRGPAALLALGVLLRPAPAHRLRRRGHPQEAQLLRQHRDGPAVRGRRDGGLDARVRARDLLPGAAARREEEAPGAAAADRVHALW